MNVSEAFFYDNAGYSYRPGYQTQEEGRRECATALASAEARAHALGYAFVWEIDHDSDSSDFSDDEPYSLWFCRMVDPEGETVEALSGIDFGPGGEPWGNTYRRVVEAELAVEQLGE